MKLALILALTGALSFAAPTRITSVAEEPTTIESLTDISIKEQVSDKDHLNSHIKFVVKGKYEAGGCGVRH